MKIAFGDTETTGFINKTVDHNHPLQVKVVQLGFIVLDTKNPDHWDLHSPNYMGDEHEIIVKPEGWTVPEQAAAIHGFTTEKALALGKPRAEAFAPFNEHTADVDLFVYHNAAYDDPVLRIEVRRGDIRYDPKRVFCTMEATTNICKLPGRFGKYKWPKMVEAYKHFFGCEFDGAHNAMADVRACRDVFLKLHPHIVCEV
jgi:DNA polymerase III epsilon subunit-like protein